MHGFKKLREVVCPILKFSEEKQTFIKVGKEKVDFFKKNTHTHKNTPLPRSVHLPFLSRPLKQDLGLKKFTWA
jgi:hypothetical protein